MRERNFTSGNSLLVPEIRIYKVYQILKFFGLSFLGVALKQ